jgi:DNA-binding transcriptional regulator YdaS (Cro superfamily)
MDKPTPERRALAEVIKKAGSRSALMRMLNQRGYAVGSHNVITQWMRTRVPANYCPDIEELTGVPCEELRPDVAWRVLRETAEGVRARLRALKATSNKKAWPMAHLALFAYLGLLAYLWLRNGADILFSIAVLATPLALVVAGAWAVHPFAILWFVVGFAGCNLFDFVADVIRGRKAVLRWWPLCLGALCLGILLGRAWHGRSPPRPRSPFG